MVDKKEAVGEGLGIAGFTMGVLSVILAGWLGIGIAIVGFIFCLVQQRKNPTKLGKVGIVINVVGFVVSILFIVVFVKYLSAYIAGAV